MYFKHKQLRKENPCTNTIRLPNIKKHLIDQTGHHVESSPIQQTHSTKTTPNANLYKGTRAHYIQKVQELINGGRRVKELIPSLLKLLFKFFLRGSHFQLKAPESSQRTSLKLRPDKEP